MKRETHTWNFADLCEAVRRSIDAAYDVTRKEDVETIPYDGPLLSTARIVASCLNIDETLSAEELENAKDNDRDALDQLIGVAVHLGIEQGFRMLLEDRYIRRMEIRDIRRALESDDPEDRRRAQESLNALERYLEDPGLMFPGKGW